MKEKFKVANIPNTIKNIERVGSIISPLVAKSKNSNIKPFMTLLLNQAANLVDGDFCPMNTFDQFFSIYISESKFASTIKSVGMRLYRGDVSAYDKFCITMCQHFSVTQENELTLIKYAVLRYIYDFLYIVKPTTIANSNGQKKFLNKCNYISCFTPRDLGINENLFTEEQHNSPIRAIVREFGVVKEMSEGLSSLQFITCPVDMFHTLSIVISQIDTFVKNNQIIRKFGKFSKMVEDEKITRKRNEMMSFDDCFSLFFSILSTSPPYNAVALWKWFEKLPTLPSTMPMNVAKATFCSAVQHIMEFSDELIEKKEEAEVDPLGISV